MIPAFFFFQMKGIFLTTAFFLYTFIPAVVLNKSSKLIHLEAYSNYIKPLNCNWPKHKFAHEIFMSQKLLFLDELSVFLIQHQNKNPDNVIFEHILSQYACCIYVINTVVRKRQQLSINPLYFFLCKITTNKYAVLSRQR